MTVNFSDRISANNSKLSLMQRSHEAKEYVSNKSSVSAHNKILTDCRQQPKGEVLLLSQKMFFKYVGSQVWTEKLHFDDLLVESDTAKTVVESLSVRPADQLIAISPNKTSDTTDIVHCSSVLIDPSFYPTKNKRKRLK
jgi:hypothetical protein